MHIVKVGNVTNDSGNSLTKITAGSIRHLGQKMCFSKIEETCKYVAVIYSQTPDAQELTKK